MDLKDKIQSFTGHRLHTVKYEEQIKFISSPEPNMRLTAGNSFFERSAEKINSEETVERFKAHYTNPNAAIDLIGSIWQENAKVWTANDRRVQFSVKRDSKTEAPDIMWWWMEEGWAAYKDGGNAFGVALGPDDVLANGGKFAYLVPTDAVLYYSNKNGNVELAEFCYLYAPEKGVYMGEEYFVFDYKGGEVSNIEQLPMYWPNTLPVFHISSKLAGIRSAPDARTNILASLFPQFENYLYYTILSHITQAFGYANVIERIRTFENCGYSDSQLQAKCQNGIMHNEAGQKLAMVSSGAAMPCPQCNSSIAIGKVVNIPIRAFWGKDATQPMSAVKFVTPDVSALEWAGKSLEKDRMLLYSSATGKGSENQIANNNFNSELSLVMAGETQHNVLMSIRQTLEGNIYHSAKIVGELFFGENFKDVFVSMGEKFSLFTREQLVALKKETDALGVTDALRIDEQLVTSTANGDPIEERRGTVILQLNKLLGHANSSKLLAVFELMEFPLNAYDAALSSNELIKKVLQFGKIDLKTLYLQPVENNENDKENGQEPTN